MTIPEKIYALLAVGYGLEDMPRELSHQHRRDCIVSAVNKIRYDLDGIHLELRSRQKNEEARCVI